MNEKFQELQYIVDNNSDSFDIQPKNSSGQISKAKQAENERNNRKTSEQFSSGHGRDIESRVHLQAMGAQLIYPNAAKYYLRALDNDLPLSSTKEIGLRPIQDYVTSKMQEQKINRSDLPGIIVNKDDPLSKKLTGSDVFKEFICSKAPILTSKPLTIIGTNAKKPESINGNKSSDRDLANTIGKIDIVYTFLDKDGNLHGYAVDIYDFNKDSITSNYKVYIARKLQVKGYLTTYNAATEIFVPQEQVKKMFLEQVKKTNKKNKANNNQQQQNTPAVSFAADPEAKAHNEGLYRRQLLENYTNEISLEEYERLGGGLSRNDDLIWPQSLAKDFYICIAA